MGRNSLRPIKSEKEEVGFSFLVQDASTVQNITIANATNSPAGAGQIEIGDTIKWVFFELNFSANVVTNPKVIHWKIWKDPNTGITGTAPSTYDPVEKKWTLHRGMEMLPKDLGTVFKRIFVVKIPRGMQRFGDNDTLFFSYISTSAEAVNVCGFAIYKHFG